MSLCVLNNPPIVLFNQVLGALYYRVEVVVILVKLTEKVLGLELGRLDDSHEFKLSLSQIWVPEVYDKNQPCLLAIVPGLVLETVIEHISLTLDLLPCLFVHPHSTVFDPHERKVESEFFISGPVMFHNVRFRS